MSNGWIIDGKINFGNQDAQTAVVTIGVEKDRDGNDVAMSGSMFNGGFGRVGDKSEQSSSGKAITEAQDDFGSMFGIGKNGSGNEIEQLLKELLVGDGYQNADGSDAIKLANLTSDSFTIEVTNRNGVTDTLTFQGDGIELILRDLDGTVNRGNGPAPNATDGRSSFNFIDVGDKDKQAIIPVEGADFITTSTKLEDVIEQGLKGENGVSILGIEKDEVTIQVEKPVDGGGTAVDTFIFFDEPNESTTEVADAIAAVANDGPAKTAGRPQESELVIADGADVNGNENLAGNSAWLVNREGISGQFGTTDESDILLIASQQDKSDKITAYDQGDTLLVMIEDRDGGATDLFVLPDDGNFLV
jgi:hypothetical protein